MFVGCSAFIPMVAEKESASDDEANRDSFECERETRLVIQGTSIEAGIQRNGYWQRCMRAKGYTIRPK